MAINDFIPKFLDPYDRPARLYPGLLVIAPVAIQIVCLYGADNTAFSNVLAVLGFCGIAYALGRIARNAGKRLQDKLFDKWGGAPTTQMLRHRDTRIDPHTKERFHRVLSKGLGKEMPTHDDERTNPVAADELYRAAATWLIIQTRNTKAFPLVFKENVAFGFHRNTLGLRPAGVTIATLCIIWALYNAKVIAFTAPFFSAKQAIGFTPEILVSLGISTTILITWSFVFTEDALKRTGFSYAEQLLQSCDQLKSSSRRSGS
jgi:hypothetical protein